MRLIGPCVLVLWVGLYWFGLGEETLTHVPATLIGEYLLSTRKLAIRGTTTTAEKHRKCWFAGVTVTWRTEVCAARSRRRRVGFECRRQRRRPTPACRSRWRAGCTGRSSARRVVTSYERIPCSTTIQVSGTFMYQIQVYLRPAAACIWNDLPPTVPNASSVSIFKKHF